MSIESQAATKSSDKGGFRARLDRNPAIHRWESHAIGFAVGTHLSVPFCAATRAQASKDTRSAGLLASTEFEYFDSCPRTSILFGTERYHTGT